MAQFATVIAIKGSGTAHAVDAKGNTRVLKTGDVLQQGETVRTTGDARIELLMMDGMVMVIAPQQAVLLDAQTVQTEQRPTAQESAVARHTTIDELLKALERGSDLSEELDPAAAGLGGGGGNDGGSSFVRLLRIVEPTEALQFQFGFRPPEPPPEAPRPLQTTLTLDEPQVSVSLTGAGVVADETTDLSVTRAGALVNVAVLMPDSDGGSVNVQLVIDRANSGLQTVGGHEVILVQGENDNVVLGMFDSNGDGVLDTRAFTVLITDAGVVTVTQQVALSHGDAGNVDEAVTLDGSLSVQVTATDSDGDTVSQSLPIGDRIAFRDDGPVIDVGLALGVEMSTLVTQDAETIGSAFDVASSSASFASLFNVTSSSGADQPATQSVGYTLAIGIGKEATGLTSHGQAVTLVMEGGDIVGRAPDGEGAVYVFRISVDADGDVTLTQYAQLDHLPESPDTSNDNALVRLAEGSVVLTASGTVTDADLDQATDKQSVDISGMFAFEDDIPSIVVGTVADGSITLATQDAQTIGVAQDTATASFAAAFLAAVTAGAGADAPASTDLSDYQFNVLSVNSGLSSHGQAITLAKEVNGDVVGSTGEGAVFLSLIHI